MLKISIFFFIDILSSDKTHDFVFVYMVGCKNACNAVHRQLQSSDRNSHHQVGYEKCISFYSKTYAVDWDKGAQKDCLRGCCYFV